MAESHENNPKVEGKNINQKFVVENSTFYPRGMLIATALSALELED